MSDIAGFYNARRDRAREAGELPGVRKDAAGVIAEIMQAVAAGELVMAPTDSQRMEELEERVAELERQRRAVLDYLGTIECPNCDHPVSLHDNRLGTCSANVNNDLGPCGCDWSSSIAEEIRDLLEEQQ